MNDVFDAYGEGMAITEESNNIYEPLKLFETRFRDEHRNNVSEYFENLVKKSNIKESDNIQTVKDIRKKETEIGQVSQKCQKQRTLKVFYIIFIVVLFIMAIIFIYDIATGSRLLPSYAEILLALAATGLAAFLIAQIINKVNKAIKNLNDDMSILKNHLAKLTNLAWSQVAGLNDLYDWGMTPELIHKTIPLINMDDYFDQRRYDYLHRKYGLSDNSDPNTSVLFVQSGDIVGNPFLLTRRRHFAMGSKSYTGSLYITWTEYYYDSNGKRQVRYRSQTLYASVVRPLPTYSNSDVLIYGNGAAPDLSFSREPSKANSLNDKQIDRLAEKESRKIEKMARKSISEGGSLTAMSNSDFDGLFKAVDRDDEVQFRLLFTPLAQKQIVDLIKDKTNGYGDDFTFIKQKCLNFIAPAHLAGKDVDASPDKYIQYDLALSRKIFNDYNNDYFRSFYFAIAPILSIPLYQQYKPEESIYGSGSMNASCWEHESIANSLGASRFKHPRSVTENILKTTVAGSADGADEVHVRAYGFEGIARVDYVPVHGGDGQWHSVPVPWIEYLPVSQDSRVIVKVTDGKARPANFKGKSPEWKAAFEKTAGPLDDVLFCKALMAFMPKTKFAATDNESLTKLLAGDDNQPQ